MSKAARVITTWTDLEKMEKVAEAIEARFAQYAAEHQFAMIDVDTPELARIAISAMEVNRDD